VPLTDFSQHLINGFSTGCIYALIALGYTMVYGILKFINFAHGEILMMGTYGGFYVYYFLISKNSSPSYMLFSFFIAMVVGAFISAFIRAFA
jgi:branched-chain amino acid transport system permease protein